MSISEYRATYPGARLYSFTCSAERHGDDPQKLMARFLAKYVTPEELAEYRKNLQWEKDHQVAFVVCRACGERLRTDLKHHLQAKHVMSTTEYLATYPGARLTSLATYARSRARVKKNPETEHAYQRTYRKAHPEKINTIQRRCYANRSPEKVQKDRKRGRVAYDRKLAKLAVLKAKADRAEGILAEQEHLKQRRSLSPGRKRKPPEEKNYMQNGALVEAKIPDFKRIFEVKGKPYSLSLNSRLRRAGFSRSEVVAAATARNSRRPAEELPVIAARHWVASLRNLSPRTISNQHLLYLSAQQALTNLTAH
jgi:hypothetical protein